MIFHTKALFGFETTDTTETVWERRKSKKPEIVYSFYFISVPYSCILFLEIHSQKALNYIYGQYG